jgi:tetratricopeptide (TPR) repeat protein/predicted Ser/Thr protein kinase
VEAPLIGHTVSHYRVIERLGSGGMGVVYRGWDERLERDVALKFLTGRAHDRALARERLAREARTLSSLDHPAIATVFDFDVDAEAGLEFLVMEFVRGVTLAERLQAGPVPEAEALAIALQAAEGLAAAHEQGVVHRDLKPANVMVTVRGHVKVLDFGLAACFDDEPTTHSRAQTRTVELVGTVPYMAPEQLFGQPIDARTDVFSFGAVLYELVTGFAPFSGRVSTAIADAILHQAPVPPRRARPGLSAGIETLILRCLEKKAADRYASARELADDLRRLAEGGEIRAARRNAIGAPAPAGPGAGSGATRVASDPVAREAYALGRRQWSKRTRESLERAIQHFDQAIDADPAYAPAYSGLADCYNILAPWLPPRLAYRMSRAAAKKAIELDATLAEAHTSLAFVQCFDDWDWAGAEATFRRAIELEPTYATAHQWYGELLTILGRFDAALVEARAAEELDVLSWAMPTTLVNVFYYSRRFDEALEYHRRMNALTPPGPTLGGLADRARILEQGGRAEEAVEEYARVMPLDDDPRIRAGYACALALTGRAAEARAEIAALEALPAGTPAPPYALAGPLALLGDSEGAFAKLEQAFAEHDRGMVWVRVNPRLDPLHGDPRFADILRRMKFPE